VRMGRQIQKSLMMQVRLNSKERGTSSQQAQRIVNDR
jgi:hypothetical protein